MKEAQIYEILAKYEISHPKYKLFRLDEKIVFDTFPCVIKIHSNKISHKSDVGGVITGITNNRSLNAAKKKILASLKKHNIALDEKDEFIVEEELNGLELFIGGIYDEIFEKVLLFGKGGTLIEIEKDICYIDTNASENEIKTSIHTTKISKIFPEFRGKQYDINLVVNTIRKFQKMFENEDILEFDINPMLYTDNGLVAVDARIKKGQKQKKEFQPKSESVFINKKVAIIGATDKKEKVGYAIAKNALKSKAKIYFVNPRLKKLFGKKVYNDLKKLPKIDTAVIAIPPSYVIETIKTLAQKGCKNFIVISAGFKETGNIEAEKELKDLAREFNLNIIGPNCLGIYNDEMKLNLTFAKSKIYSGNIGLISQSGAVLTALLDKASHEKIGFSHIISMGNMADFNFAHAINELNKQQNCKVISIYAEGLQYGKEFLKAIRNSQKPVLLFKSGKSAQAKKAAFSHTGNIAGNYEMIINLSKNAGAFIKNSAESLIFSPKYLNVKEVLIVTNAGGPGAILTDLVSRYKKLVSLDNTIINALNSVLPNTWSHNNPIDIIGDATAKRYDETLKILRQVSELIYVIVTPQFMTDSEEIAKILIKYDNVIPIFLGKRSFISACKILNKSRKLYFNSLEEAAKIL
ncbi:acetate--CoA ligase family protein [Nautilia lithotrophica]